MKATVLLADSAQVVDGKVYALGLGWNATLTPTPPCSVVLLLEVGWDETDRDIDVHVELLDEDGRAVTFPSPFGPQPIVMDGRVNVTRPAGAPAGVGFIAPFALNVAPGMPLNPGRYEWRVIVDGKRQADWSASFTVTPQPTAG